jgi:hypothetical protein
MRNFTLDGEVFRQRLGPPSERGVSDEAGFVLVKTDEMLDFYRRLGDSGPRTVMEVGMYEGGSLVLFDKLYKPKTLVGIDLRAAPIEALEDYRRRHPHVITVYGQAQQDKGTADIARRFFPDGIDLVVDDASHHFEETRATFELLFPLVSPGGHYVIEDWSWSHGKGRQEPGTDWFDRPALTNLIFELVVGTASSEAIKSLHIEKGLACVQKGSSPYGSGQLDIEQHLRGRTLALI